MCACVYMCRERELYIKQNKVLGIKQIYFKMEFKLLWLEGMK